MERYDAAIIGAGLDGLIAAHRLAQAGLSTVVLEREPGSGGRAATREFHPGFRASPFLDELAPLPQRLFWELDPARHGAVLKPAAASVCVSGEDTSLLFADETRLRQACGDAAPAVSALRRELALAREAIAARALAVDRVPAHSFWRPEAARMPWPGESWAQFSLAEALSARIPDRQLQLHLAAACVSGRAASPYLAGTAVHLLALERGGAPAGGLGTLAAALDHSARAAGAHIRCDAEVVEIRMAEGRAAKLVLKNGEEIVARAVLSTLDLKRTFLDLVPARQLPDAVLKQVARFRSSAAAARVLLALGAIPRFAFAREAPDAARGDIHVIESLDVLARAADAWRGGALPGNLLVTLRVPSLSDPRLAPPGKAVMTATLSPVPARLMNGDWMDATRNVLFQMVLVAAERVSPGIADTVLAHDTIIAADIERALGVSGGDLDGGELAPDQMLGFRPFPDWQPGRTPVAGLYLGGVSAAPSPFLTGVAGERAARALLQDLKSQPAP